MRRERNGTAELSAEKGALKETGNLVFHLALVGLLLVTGAWTEMMRWLQGWLAANGFAESIL